MSCKILGAVVVAITVDGRNPASVSIDSLSMFIPLFAGFNSVFTVVSG